MLWIAVALYAIACRTSLYSLRKSYTPAAMPGCGAAGGCDAVLSSRWSRVAGKPVAMPGAFVYLLLMFLAAAVAIEAVGEWGRWALSALSIMAAGAAIWFVAIQALAIRRFCLYCMTAHLCALAACGVVLATVGWTQWIIAVAAVMVAMLIAIQILFSSPTYTLDRAVGAPAESQSTQRVVRFHGGKIEINTADWPVAGGASGAYVVAKLVDYTCEECRHLHHLLREVRPKLPERLAVVSIPVPLDLSCNPEATPQDPRHVNACQYARCALAVFIAAPERFGEFEEWLFEKPTPPNVTALKARATQIVGAEDFALVFGAPEIDESIRQAVSIYRQAGGGVLPKLLLPGAVLFGRVPTAGELEKLLVEQLRMRSDAAAPSAPTY